MDKLYKDYFAIDPKYYAAVTADLIEQGKVSWKNFYPHDTFVKLLETTYKVLSGAASRSIWVEGAYGTGKSHAALTVKSLVDASEEEVEDYFQDYGLSKDLCNKFNSVKNGGKIITIHRIGSAGINTDTDLILAVQQSITAALRANGIENQGDSSMKDAFLKWAEKGANRNYFNALISEEKYLWDFGGMSADEVIEKLKNSTEKDIESMMRNVMKVLKDAGQTGIFKDVNDMADWIKSIIEENNIASILFVWDEFSEYFLNHPVGLTGFQTLAEISQSHPFYFMIVAHESRNLFADADTAKKTLDRFEPSVKIELPENMAFRLMAQAMKKSDDAVLSREWVEEYAPTLNDELVNVRNVIATTAKKQSRLGQKTVITDKELQSIVPIHPYAALLLKHIATVFNSNQRSMFDFIISNDMTDAKGFKWYINNYGPMDELNLLTIDLLWDFFCGKEQNGLNDDVRGVLDSYRVLQSDKLLLNEQRVLKTILLLQAISLRVTGNDLLIPNDQNIDLAFGGTDWNKGQAIAIANGLIEKGLLFKKPIAGGKFEYCVVNQTTDGGIAPYRKKVTDETKTSGLIVTANLMDAIQLPASIRNRYVMDSACNSSFTSKANAMNSKTTQERFKVIVTFAMDDVESAQIRQQILKNVNQPKNNVIYIESLTPMGKDLFEQYVDSMAFSRYNTGKDKAQATHYEKQAMSVLNDWRSKIASGAFVIYDADRKGGQRMANLSALNDELKSINAQTYFYGLEGFHVIDNMFMKGPLPLGAECGINQTLRLTYKSNNERTSLATALSGAWQVENYWEDTSKQSLPIVHIKKKVDEVVQEGFNSGAGRIGISTIISALEAAPFGFIPCNIAAFVLGFVLKEYATADYFWSNGSNSESMTVDKMKTMIANGLNQRVTATKNYKEEFIVAMSAEMRGFLSCTSKVFKISSSQCGSVESARDQIRIQMKKLSFPVWCIKYSFADEQLTTPADVLMQIIDDYMGIANTANSDKATESDLAERIGRTIKVNPSAVAELERLVTSNQCQKGMLAYIGQYQGGLLPKLAAEINDGGAYLAQVKSKFSAGDANWVWNSSTADERISDVILEYQIIAESNKSLPPCTSLKKTITEWNLKTNNIKLPCDAAKKHVGDLGPFLEQLKYLKQSNALSEQNKQAFYDLLSTQRESFDRFYKNQVPYFVRDAKSFLSDLDDEDIFELYGSIPGGQFTKNTSEYYRMIQAEVDKFVLRQWKKKLRDLWRDKTGTADPYDWSERFDTPILCMFDDSERSTARSMFSIIMRNNPTEADAKKAMAYLENAGFYSRLSDGNERDKCFMERIVKDYSILLQDAAKVRSKLRSTVSSFDKVYDWMDNSTVQNQIRKMADMQYKLTGCEQAMEVINQMSAEQLRKYLRDRIMYDADFGMQILKGE